MTAQTLTSVRAKPRLRREEDAAQHERKPGPTHERGRAHISVMTREVVELLAPEKGDVVVDCTLGVGGHSEAILKHSGVSILALDADKAAIAIASERLKQYKNRIRIVEANFRDLAHVLKKEAGSEANKFLFDLGWNREQLSMGRGFSFLTDEPLVMSYGEKPASGFTAADILNQWDEKVLADVFFGYGEERYARPIAKAIIARREFKPFESTIELVEVIKDAVPGKYRRGRLHVATRTFQALRIATNDELGSIEKGLAAAWEHLPKGGRIVVISFHSIEDRLVKKTFASWAKKNGHLLVKKPLTATRAESTYNPSARSAKLRAIEKI